MAKRTGAHKSGDESGQPRAKAGVDQARREAVMRAVMNSARGKTTSGPDAARSQDFLYDDEGLPR